MNTQKHNWILYLISITILATVTIQFYWNYKNYQQNKQRVLNEIQLSLDNAVEQYYSDLSKKNFLTIVKPKDTVKKFSVTSISFNSDDNKRLKKTTDSLLIWSQDIINEFDKENSKINLTQLSKNKKAISHYKEEKVKVFRGKKASDSLKLIKNIKTVFISIHNDSLQPKQLDSILKKELANKKIDINYGFKFYKKDSLQSELTPSKNFIIDNKIEAKSTFLGVDKRLNLFFENPTKEALKRSSTGILLSLLLALAVISSLFYLLKIINQQKQLAEIKNDLISNITHEFKTPITTASTALEAIDSFNVIDNKEKTKNYVAISKNQLEKLSTMVEKLLETATLDSENLLLQKEKANIINLIENITKKHLFTTKKSIYFNSSVSKFDTEVDVFHFENAISNLIDNAIKYGGNNIKVSISSEEKNIIIKVSDNGKGIKKAQQELIFDKFYRVPKGNTHNVKGFGIGLYYTKKIIEKHNGTIRLQSNTQETIFIIQLPNE